MKSADTLSDSYLFLQDASLKYGVKSYPTFAFIRKRELLDKVGIWKISMTTSKKCIFCSKVVGSWSDVQMFTHSHMHMHAYTYTVQWC